jgi:hypothetical protein
MRFMALLAVNELKAEVDEEIVTKAIRLADWQLEVRRLHDPIDAENTTAKIEEKIRRQLRTGPKTERELKQKTNAHRNGLWFFNMAMKNLTNAREMIWDRKVKQWKLI